MKLGVNVDHVATLRQARGEVYPDPIKAAVLAELAGADNITCHLREDRRHIQDHDVFRIKDIIQIPLNFEMGATDEMVGIALEVQPHTVTLVPEKREELTTEGGLDVIGQVERLGPAIQRLKDANIIVSLFIEPDEKVIEVCQELGADSIELHTGRLCKYLDCRFANESEKKQKVDEFSAQADFAQSLGLYVGIGHGINYINGAWMQYIPAAREANIGHSIIGQSVYIGLDQAIKDMKALINDPAKRPIG